MKEDKKTEGDSKTKEPINTKDEQKGKPALSVESVEIKEDKDSIGLDDYEPFIEEVVPQEKEEDKVSVCSVENKDILNRYFTTETNAKCYRCRKVGHTKDFCPSNVMRCNYCLGSHERRYCTLYMACFICGSPDHIKSACRMRRNDLCRRCGKAGHEKKNCNFLITFPDDSQQRQTKRLTCIVCKRTGHLNCSNSDTRRTLNDEVYKRNFMHRLPLDEVISLVNMLNSETGNDDVAESRNLRKRSQMDIEDEEYDTKQLKEWHNRNNKRHKRETNSHHYNRNNSKDNYRKRSNDHNRRGNHSKQWNNGHNDQRNRSRNNNSNNHHRGRNNSYNNNSNRRYNNNKSNNYNRR